MLSRLIFSVTYDCPVTCKYCVTESGPAGGPYLDAAFMKKAVSETAELGMLLSVVFTGGEPLLRRKEVEETLRFAQARGLWTRIVTNAFWATSREKAGEVLSSLKEAGLKELNFSCDDFHQENIPLENVHHAFWAARDLKIPTLIAHRHLKNEKVTVDFLSQYLAVPLQEFKLGEKNPSFDVYSSGYTIPIGHGAKWLKAEDYIVYPPGPEAWKATCSGVLNGLVVSPTQEVRLCCGMIDQTVPELSLGRWGSKPLAQIVCEANCDLIANWLALEGPYGIMRFIQEKDPDIRFQDRYVNHCHLCDEIFTRPETRGILLQYGDEKAEEIGLRRGLLEGLRFKDSS